MAPRSAPAMVLVVDDEEALRTLFGEAIRDAGFDVAEAASAEAALEVLESTEVAMLVTDIELPGRSGVELLEQTRALRPELPMLAMSGSAPEPVVAAAIRAGASAFVAKPVSLGSLVEAIRRALVLRPL